MVETKDIRLKRLAMRSMRRGIKEMDLILSTYATRNLSEMTDTDLDLYEDLLQENDQDLYAWVTGQVPAPQRFFEMINQISNTFEA